jgi:hypothetical protein
MTFLLHNPNKFKLKFALSCDEKQFDWYHGVGFIEGRSYKELQVEFKPWDISEDEIMPKIQSFTGNLNITFHILQLPIINISINGHLVDVNYI